mmetsp:Transcript_9114/g.12223  ORF Transcript_9114/g.12223 Transcript_9114/m.12223 type:complete len:358 (-) Transcript_9114:94-1167(-)|eukprot:CAMPEP_0201487916 /NCGR_PEP_ID=MMETSP0151_2-20130828/16367_1 /ASSEMBLY_ACC=CAM_ASM_000257 /TAXON_ID=200890 /ORGANISM="Paramoeba atlantica, Strain 621/1 / CCAP 1560/9" /LENGTH=357 /DNA_ID=CAMNT_0047873091 /DNA_START=49 /DNA_END=1122 /DNA_ORIENTATION=-
MKFFFGVLLLSLGLVSALPTNFDARDQWSNCGWFILNQESCGSCWDFCSVESFADRLCINNEAKAGTIISPETILDCSSQGCDGGYPKTAWNYLIKSGSTTCDSECFSGCQPYDSGDGKSPKCHQGTCDSGSKWPATYYGASYESLSSRNPDLNLYQTELYDNGPLQACFTVYSNFYTYFSLHPKGIYTSESGSVVGGHCVKMVGWGTDGGQDYWTFANSWDTTWGDGGYFKMARGNNLCGIEKQVSEGFTPSQAKKLGKPIGIHNFTEDNMFLVGGWSKHADFENEFILDAVDAGLRLLSNKMGRTIKFTEILSAETQVVAGVNYRFVLNSGEIKIGLKIHRDLASEYSMLEYRFL